MVLGNYYEQIISKTFNTARTCVSLNGGNITVNVNSPNAGFLLGGQTYIGDQAGSYGIAIGSGDTPPSMNDYNLENRILGVGGTVHATREKMEDGGCRIVYTITLANTTSEEVTVREVGVIGYGASSFLLERTVLDEPVTIPAGGVGQITYTIRMNYPAA